MSRPGGEQRSAPADDTGSPDLGDVVIALLASTLAGLRDRLAADGFEDAAELVGDLVEVADDYLVPHRMPSADAP